MTGPTFSARWLLVALLATSAWARAGHHVAHGTSRATCCRAAAGTEIQVELAEPVSTRTQKTGDSFALKLASPLIVGDQVLLRAGTPGVGDVIEAARPGIGGKAAKLVLAARYLKVGVRRVPLAALQLARAGRSNTMEASAVGLTGIAFAPLGFIGLAVRGGHVDFPAGEHASARLATDVVLPPLGRAPPGAAVARAPDDADTDTHGAIDIPPPPKGEGQVVFFRRKSLLALGQWFKVRENGKPLCKLASGVYCIQATPPGAHTYTAKFEPELKDHLTLQVDAGETYFVEGQTSNALVVGAADLYPSDRATFNLASKKLKPAGPVANDADDGPNAGETGTAAGERP